MKLFDFKRGQFWPLLAFVVVCSSIMNAVIALRNCGTCSYAAGVMGTVVLITTFALLAVASVVLFKKICFESTNYNFDALKCGFIVWLGSTILSPLLVIFRLEPIGMNMFKVAYEVIQTLTKTPSTVVMDLVNLLVIYLIIVNITVWTLKRQGLIEPADSKAVE